MREISELAASIMCPRCRRNTGRMELEAVRGVVECKLDRCGQHWWVMRLNAGEIYAQLVPVFGEELARVNMVTWKLPESLDVGCFWQLSLSRNVYEASRGMDSSRLLTALVDLFRARNSLVPRPSNK